MAFRSPPGALARTNLVVEKVFVLLGAAFQKPVRMLPEDSLPLVSSDLLSSRNKCGLMGKILASSKP